MKSKLLLSFLWVSSGFAIAQQQWPEELLLTPEKANFVKTSTYQDVVNFLQAIQLLSNNVQITSMGKSPEGKEIPVAILSNPKITTPAQAKASGKVIVYVQGNIHAGEVEGKESIMMLMRDILLGDKKHLLDNQIILFVPIYNTDSNDKMEKGRRPSQEDSPLEIGIRENSQGLDLNRDGVKMEALETKWLFKNIIVPWDPHVFMDLHTTNGTWHAWNLTWAPSYHYAGEESTYDYTLNKILKPVTATVRKKYDLNFGPYGDYYMQEGWPPKNFYTYNHHPRYLVNQFSLRNRIAILSEAFAHERFYQRMYSTYVFILEILEHTNTHAKEVMDITQTADDLTIKLAKERAGKIEKGVRFKMVASEKLKEFPTYDFIQAIKGDSVTGVYRTGKIVSYHDVTYYGGFEAEQKSNLPSGYIIPSSFKTVVENLRAHGIQVTQLAQSAVYTGQVFQIEKFEKSERKFEGHFMARAFGKFVAVKRKFSKGSYVVDLNQPLGNLAFYLLEPESDDGLLTWNFFDDYVEQQGGQGKAVEYPVFKFFR
jgi:hypothetical protein